MSAETVTQVVEQLTQRGTLEKGQVETALATTFWETDEGPNWKYYEFTLPQGPFVEGELRLNKEGTQTLLSLVPREMVVEADLNLKQWGELVNIDVNPRIPPEGTDAYTYAVKGLKVSFQFTHNSRQLRAVALEWEKAAA